MFEIFVRNPEYDRQDAARLQGVGWGDDVGIAPRNPNIPEFITERVHGISATVENGSLIIVEGNGTVSAIYPTYTWNKALKVQAAGIETVI
jgi:hypothetical protein